MTKRKTIGKTLRFEVFKRDKFTCQYCGGKAPDVVLHVDHMRPVADGGKNDIMNLVTSCAGCNGGKGARLLTDDSIVERQRKQIEDLEARRQQLEMMLQWREELSKLNESVEQAVCDHLTAVTGFTPNKSGMVSIRKWIKAFPLETVLNSIDDAFARYGCWRDDQMTEESWNVAFNKVGGFCQNKVRYGDGPEIDDLLYVQGIIRRRIGDRYFKALPRLKEMQDAGYSASEMKRAACDLDDRADFDAWCCQWLREGVDG